jgi:acyl-CoA reductase-like NAD-dependent aldehyde dehydrogenase
VGSAGDPGDAAAAVAAALGRARDAGERLGARPRAEIVRALGRVLDALRDAGSPPRRRLEAELPAATGFSPEVVREGLARALAPWSGAALHALAEAELGTLLGEAGPRRAAGFPTTGVVLGGALPTPTLIALAAPLLLGSGVVAKTAAHDPVTARVLVDALAAEDEGLGAALEVVSFPGDDVAASAALLEADCVVATGSDATVAGLAARVAPPRRFVGYGHRTSVAVLGPGAARPPHLESACEALAFDVAVWDQLGCLSPTALYVVGDTRVGDALLDALGDALDRAEARWPRGRVEVAAAAALAHERDEASLRAAAGSDVRLRIGAGGAWTVVAEADARPRAAPGHRFLRVHPAPDTGALLRALAPLGPHLAAVGIAGLADGGAPLAGALARLGASRICPLGTLQTPPLAWCHDGRGVLLPLARLLDVEA